MFLRWIEETRKKPKAVRDQYAFFAALVLTVCVVGIWSLSLPSHFASIDEKYDDGTESEGLFSGFVGDVKEQFASALSSQSADQLEESDQNIDLQVSSPSLQLDDAAVQNLRDQFEATNQPEQRVVLIGTSSKEHTNATSEAQ